MADPDDDTLIECRACGGHWKLANGAVCRWCTAGLMDMPQLLKWRDHKSGSRPAFVLPPSGATGA
jgi:hypothetical protein